MNNDRITKCLILIISILIIVVLFVLIFFDNNSSSIKTNNSNIEVTADNIVFVGENGTITVNSQNDIKLIYKYGYLSSPQISYPGGNSISVPFSAKRAGLEEVELKSGDITKKINIRVCEKLKLSSNKMELVIGSSKKFNLNLSDDCISEYRFMIANKNIASYTNGMIYAKAVGTTTLNISRANENLTYTIKVKPKEIKFISSSSSIKIGESLNLEVSGADDTITCKASNDLVSVTSTNNGCLIAAKKAGTVTITAVSGESKTQANITIIDPTIAVTSITLNQNVIRVAKGKYTKLVATVSPSNATNKNVTWTSSNNRIVSVASDGTINALALGAVKVTAKSNNGKIATASVIVTDSNMIAEYNSKSLKYWITKGGTYYNVTYIWVEDAYSQFKVAITEPKSSSSSTPRYAQGPKAILNYLLKTNPSYMTKGLVAGNASSMVSTRFGTAAPSHWFGTAQIPLILNNGKVIRDSSNEKLLVGKSVYIYGMKKDGNLTYYKYNHSGESDSDKVFNKNVVKTVKNDGVLYTFGFSPILVWNGAVATSSTDPNIRQGLCQVDKNNFIMVTNTNATNNRSVGFGLKQLGEYLISLNCKTALNLDGGGSTSFYYKKSNSELVKVSTGYDGRDLADMVYFVEK